MAALCLDMLANYLWKAPAPKRKAAPKRPPRRNTKSLPKNGARHERDDR
jgi:hypothetical protein